METTMAMFDAVCAYCMHSEPEHGHLLFDRTEHCLVPDCDCEWYDEEDTDEYDTDDGEDRDDR